jgi:uncharacterized protein
MSIESLFVLDANVIVSASLIKEGKARKALDKAQAQGLVLMSVSVLVELEEVLARPKFDKYITITERKLFLAGLVKTVQFVEIEEIVNICRDSKDDKYLELAANGKATCIISGDEDLLILNPFRDVPILTVQAFLELNLS